MPTLDANTDLHLALTDDDCAVLLTERIAERQKRVERNNAQRQLARLIESVPAPAQAALAAAQQKVADAQAIADGHRAAFDTRVAQVKAAHGAEHLEPTAEGYNPATGRWQMTAKVQLRGAPPVERKRIRVSDADCDAFAASYAAGITASDEAFDLMRQIEAYKVAHPELFAGSVGEPPPVDPDYEALKDALAAKQAATQAAMETQAGIMATYLAGEPETYYRSLRIESGEIVLGDKE